MASLEEGSIDDERFQTAVPQNLHCAICLNVLRKPMQCVKNEHSFCKPCITRHLQTTPRCPTCIEPLTLATLRPSRLVSQLLSQLMIRCDNFHRGCLESVKMEMLEAHVRNCEFSPVQCSNDGCEVIIDRKDQADHEINDCDHRQGKCEVCGKQVAYAKRQLHCYVTRNEIDEMKRDLKVTKVEVSNIKDIVTNLSREVTRHMGDMKEQMVDMNKQMVDMKMQMKVQISEVKHEMAAIKKECRGMKQKLENPDHFLGPSLAHFQPNVSQLEKSNRRDIVIAGGASLKSVEMFSWATRKWAPLPEMTLQRWWSSSFVHQGQLYVCGGWDCGDRMEVLQLRKDGGKWRNVPCKLPRTTRAHASVVYKGNLFIFGGLVAAGGMAGTDMAVTDIYKVHFVQPYSCMSLGRMPEPRTNHGVQCFGGKIVIVGGTTTGLSSDALNTVLAYDIASTGFQALAPLPFAVCYMATVAWKDSIILMGGEDRDDNVLDTVVRYDTSNGKSEMLPAMKTKRRGCHAVITGNMVVVMGGWNEDDGSLCSVECFNLNDFTWDELPPTNEERYGATAVAI